MAAMARSVSGRAAVVNALISEYSVSEQRNILLNYLFILTGSLMLCSVSTLLYRPSLTEHLPKVKVKVKKHLYHR